jgi:cysteinyl-tRNA synthetase
MHNGHLQVEGEKMSKSLGNFVTIHELLHTDKFGGRSWPGEVLRLALLRTHYRQPIDFTVKALEEAERILDEWYRQIIASLRHEKPEGELDVTYLDTLADDFNTPAAVARLHWLYDHARTVGGSVQLERKYRFRDSARAIGLLRETADAWFASRMVNIDEEDIKSAIEERLAARAAKNWKESDRIRDELAAMGIALKDNKDGTTTWEVNR